MSTNLSVSATLNVLTQAARSQLSQGKSTEAVALCQHILKQAPDWGMAYQLLGMAREAQGEVEEAMFAYSRALQLQPELVEAWAYLGQLCADRDWPEEAARHYQQALQLRPGWLELQVHLAEVLQQQGDLAGAAKHYQQVVAQTPNNAVAHYNLGVILDGQNQLDAARECYQQAIDLQPDYLKAYSNLGCIWVKQDRSDRAIVLYQNAIRKASPSEGKAHDWAALYNNLGQAWMALGQQDERQRTQGRVEAMAAYHRAMEFDPGRSLTYYNLGKVWQQQSQHDRAIECFQRATQLDPQHIAAYSDLGFSLMARGKLKQAMVCFHQAVACQPEFVEAYCQWKPQRSEADEFDRALGACFRFLQALQRQPEAPEVLVHLAETYAHLGNVLFEYGGYDRAGAYYQRAIQIESDRVDLYLRLGNCLAKQKRLNSAVVIYHFALGMQPDNLTVFFQLGRVLERQQKWEQASHCYDRVLRASGRGLVGLERDLLGDVSGDRQQVLKRTQTGFGETRLELESKSDGGTLLGVPQGIYRSTWDWAAANQGEGFQGCFSGGLHRRDRPSPQPPIPYPGKRPQPQNCGGLTCGSCLKRLCGWFEPVHLGWGVYQCSPPDVLPIDSPPNFVATIPEGRVWIVPQQNDWMVCKAMAIVTPDRYLLADVSRDFPWYLPGCQHHDPTQHQVFELEDFPPLEWVDGTVAVLSSLSGHIYYHWTIDVLPRIEILRRSAIDLDEIDWFLVNSLQKPFQRETLKWLGIPEGKILESDRHPHLQAKRLVVPSFPGHLDWIPPQTVEFLRQEFLTAAIKDSDWPERVYISRANAKHRRVLNEEEVVRELGLFGFVPVCLERLSLEEQISLFASAKVIVSPHGSGLTNTVFCGSGTTIIELFSPHYIRPDYWMTSYYLGLKHYYIIGQDFSCYPLRQLMYPNPLTEDIFVNLNSLKRILRIQGF